MIQFRMKLRKTQRAWWKRTRIGTMTFQFRVLRRWDVFILDTAWLDFALIRQDKGWEFLIWDKRDLVWLGRDTKRAPLIFAVGCV